MPTAPTKAVPPFPDVEAVAEETSAREANRMLRAGWVLLQVVCAHDGVGGYPVYVLGRTRRPEQPDKVRVGEQPRTGETS